MMLYVEPAPELLKSILEILNTEITPNYHWPGNVRELEQATRRILLTRHYKGDTSSMSASLTGQLQKAIETAQNALALERSSGKEALEIKIQKRLELYKAHQPYRSSPDE